MNMKEKSTDAEQRVADKVEIAIRLDSELLEQIQHLTNRDDELTRTPVRKPLPPRGEWND
jgi:hypothetical protein